MLSGNKLVQEEEQLPRRNSRLVSKAKEGSSVTILVPTLLEMSKALMRMRCSLDKADNGDSLEEFSNLESAMMKMTIDIEYLRRKGY